MPSADARVEAQWLRCTLTQDIVRNESGSETRKALTGVIFIIDEGTRAFYTYREDTKSVTKLQADVEATEVTFFDGPLQDTISRVTGAFSVVASPYHEANGACVPIDPLSSGKPKF